MLMLLMPFISIAADTIRVNIPRVTVTMARNYNFSSAANSVYVPVEFNSSMSADKVADYIEESNAYLFDHYGEDVVEISGVSDDFGTIYLDIKPNTGIKRVLLITSVSSDSKVITVIQAGDTPEPEPEPEPEPDEKFNIPGNWKMVRHYTDETGNSYPQFAANLYKYNGKELQTVGGIGFTDYGARMYDDFTGRWFVPDPLAEKYASMSPYMYCGGNPIMYVDTDGKEPRIFVETKGVGHAFVTVGSGDNTIVYTYGRYGELGKNKSFARSTTPTGEGILIRLSGERAKEFIKDQMIEKGAKAYEFKDGSDDAVMKYYDDLFYSSDKIPKVGKYAGDSDARVINTYNLFNNNCVTTSIDGIKTGSKESIDLKWLMCPDNLEFVLSNKVESANSNVITIKYEDLKKELNLKNGAGGSW